MSGFDTFLSILAVAAIVFLGLILPAALLWFSARRLYRYTNDRQDKIVFWATAIAGVFCFLFCALVPLHLDLVASFRDLELTILKIEASSPRALLVLNLVVLIEVTIGLYLPLAYLTFSGFLNLRRLYGSFVDMLRRCIRGLSSPRRDFVADATKLPRQFYDLVCTDQWMDLELDDPSQSLYSRETIPKDESLTWAKTALWYFDNESFGIADVLPKEKLEQFLTRHVTAEWRRSRNLSADHMGRFCSKTIQHVLDRAMLLQRYEELDDETKGTLPKQRFLNRLNFARPDFLSDPSMTWEATSDSVYGVLLEQLEELERIQRSR
jgi:hypothetical protein